MNEKREGVEPGKVLWLEPVHLHFHHGHEVRVKVLWGEGMKPEGALENENLTAFVADPAGNRREARLVSLEGGQCAVAFEAGDEGIYTLTVGAAAGIARVMVPVGHHVSGKGKAGGSGLEIVPVYYYEFRHNDATEIQVFLDGRLLSGAQVKATYHLYEGPQLYPYQVETNERGIFRFTFKEKGHWLFVVERDDKFATLVVPGVH